MELPIRLPPQPSRHVAAALGDDVVLPPASTARERHYSVAFEHASVGIAICALDGRFLEVNQALGRILGRPPGELLGLSWQDVTYPEELPASLAAIADLVAGVKTTVTLAKRYRRPAGEVVWCNLIVSVVQDTDGAPLHIVAQIEDVTDRRVAEQALRDAHARLAMAFEDAPIGVALVAPDGRYLEVNPMLCELLGRSRDELLALTWRDVTHPDDLPADEAAIVAATAAGEGRITIDKRFVHADGTSRWVRLNASVLRDEDGTERYSVVQAEDVTSTRRAEQAVVASEAHFRATFDRAPIGMAVIALDGRLSDVNDALCTMLGRPRGELVGTAWQDLISSAAAEPVIVPSGSSGEGALRVETPLRRSDDTLVWVEVSSYLVRDSEGHALHRFAQFHDVSERHRAEEALRESERRFTTIFESSPIGMALYGADGTRLAANAALAEMLGYSVAELMAGRFGDMAAGDDQEQLGPLVESLFAGEIDDYSLETRFVHRHGHPLPVEVVVSLIRDEQGAPLYVVSQVADVAERRRLEDQIQQASKLEAIGRLAGGVAHDFNNMLLVVRGYSHLLLEHLAEGDPARGDVVEIDRAAERAAQLVGQLLAFGRRQFLQPRLLDLNELIVQTISLVRRLTGDGIELRTDLTAGLEPIRADPAQLEQVIVNLAINSRDATPAGGVVTISSRAVLLDAIAAAERGVVPGRYAVLEVSDTGTGMDAATAARAFEPFFTTKGEGAGTGLGLAAVHGTVTQSGGGIVIASTPGQGTTVTVYLPLASSMAPSEPVSVAARSVADETVLLVEDDVRSRALLTRVLRDGGRTAVAFGSPVEALAWLDAAPRTLRAVVSDIVMPEMHGAELARAVHERLPGVPILLISGYADATLADDLIACGVRLLAKPFTPAELLAAIEQHFDDASDGP